MAICKFYFTKILCAPDKAMYIDKNIVQGGQMNEFAVRKIRK